ncbi:PHD finger protein 3, partial [Caligus rogercresseyi]
MRINFKAMKAPATRSSLQILTKCLVPAKRAQKAHSWFDAIFLHRNRLFYYEAMTQADIDSFLRPTAQEHSKEDTPDMDIHLSTDDSLKESLEILESSSELSTQKEEVHEPDKDPLLCDSYNEEYVSAVSPPHYHLLSNPNYIPKLNEVISIINKAKNGHITLCTSPPAKEDVKGGYIYVFKSENDLLENTTNEGECSIVMKKFPITNSDISIIERLESNSNLILSEEPLASSDPSTIVVAYIGSKSSTNASVNRGNNDDVKLVILEDQKLSLNNRSSIKSVPISYKVSRAILSFLLEYPSYLTIKPSPKKANIEVVDLSSDDEDTTKSGQNTPNSSSKKRKKRLQYTPKRLVMPNLPPKQSEYLKYRRKLSMDVSGEKTPHPPNEENNS